MERSKAGLIPLSGIKEVLNMLVVKKMPGDSDEALIRKFSRKVLHEGILQEAKRRAFYLKPSLARKQKKEDSRRARSHWVYSH
jgi:ribosomal protein S21